MTIGQLIVYLIVALLCGIVGQMLVGRSVGGWVVSTVVGLLGAILGTVIAAALGAPEPLAVTIGGRTTPILWTIVGAALVTLVVAHFQRGRLSSSKR